MAQDSTKTVMTLGILGVIGYFVYQWWTGQSTTATSSCPASSFLDPVDGSNCPSGMTLQPNPNVLNQGCPQYECTDTSATAATNASPSGTPAPTATPVYTGDSLAQMFAALQATVAASYGQDPALTCEPSGVSGLGVLERAAMPTSPAFPRGGDYGPVAVSPVAPNVPVSGTVSPAPVSTAPATPATCSNPYATYDVFNYYLVQANIGVTAAPAPPDHTSQISLTDYWAWAAPLLQQQMPGLSGFGHVYAGLGMLTRAVRGW